MANPLWKRIAGWLLLVTVLAYLILGTLYAVYTPDWQAPDEPAHYNYVQYVAEQRRFPILKPGDFPAAYLEEIKSAQFPPEMSIAPIRYEFHQPPLYYILAAPVYQLFGDHLSGSALLPLRLLSVGLGAVLLVVTYWIVQALAPDRPYLALGATAFVAFLPMHLAMVAAVNNDTLAELLLALLLLLTIRYLKLPGAQPEGSEGTRLLVLLGITTGLIFVTKSSVYIALPLVLLAIAARHVWLDKVGFSLVKSLRATAFYLLPAVALGLPWWLRCMAIYGGFDFLGLGRHDQIVVGQLRTAEFVAEHGLARLVGDFLATSFRSFWGLFGWMGVLLDQRIYQALAFLSALAFMGFVIWAIRVWPRRTEQRLWQWVAGGLLALSGFLTLASYIWYNTGFLQHQGRYLFRALPAIGVAVAVGWREALRQKNALPLAILLFVTGIALRLAGALSNWPSFILVATAIVLFIRRFLPRGWDPCVYACPYLVLVPLDLVSLFLFVLPQLAS